MRNPPIALPAPRVAGRPARGKDVQGQRLAGRPGARDRTRTLALERARHAPDYAILVAVVALTAIGILMVYSSSGIRAYVTRADSFADVGPQLVWAMLGILAMVIATRIDYRFWRFMSLPLFVAALALLALVLVPSVGTVVGGSARWLKLGPLPAIHPAEFAKLALVVYLAHWMASRGTRISSVVHGTLPFLLIAGPVIALVIKEPDLGTTGVLAVTAFILFFVAGANLWQFVLMAPAAVAAVVYVVSSHPYQLQRVMTFLDPWSDPRGTGFHTIQGLLALALGGIAGEGLGQSRSAGGLYLPNASNDFIFAVIGEEFGLIGGLLVIGLFLLFAYRGVKVALAAPDTFGALMATGITAWLTFQAFVNIGVVVNLLPITGITLPFVSDGGSSLIVSFAAVGILLSISRETQARGTWNDADPHRRRWFRRAHPAGPGGRAVPARAAKGR